MECKVNINSKLYKSILVQSSSVDSALRTYLAMKRDGWTDDQEVSKLPNLEEDTTYGQLLKAKVIRLQKTQDSLNKIENSIKKAVKRGEKAIEFRKRRTFLSNRINELNEDIKLLETANTIEGLKAVYLSDGEFIDQLLQTGEIEDLDRAYTIINTYKDMGDFSDFSRIDHPLFNKDLLQILDPEGQEVSTLQEWAASMQLKESKLNQAYKDKLVEIANNSNRYKNRDSISYDELMVALKDMGFIDKNTMALGEEGIFGGSSEISKIAMDYILQDRSKATLEIAEKSKEHKELLEKAQIALRAEGFTGSNLYEVFKQLHKGKFTGRLASRFSQSFFEERKKSNNIIYSDIDEALESKDQDKIQKAYRAKEKWKRENEILFDIRKLPEIKTKFTNITRWNLEDSGEHKSKLIEVLGEKGYKKEIDKQINSLEIYLSEEEYYKEYTLEKYNISKLEDNKEAWDEFHIWQRVNSPFWAATYVNSKDRSNLKYEGKYLNEYTIDLGRGEEKANYRGYEYLNSIPRKNKAQATWDSKEQYFKVNETQETLNYYDNNFIKIESNEDIYKYYNFLINTLSEVRDYLPLKVQEKFETIYDVPLYKKEFSEKMLSDGGSNLLSFGKLSMDSFYNHVVDSLSDTEASTMERNVDKFAKVRDEQNYNFIGNRREKVQATYDLKLLEYMQKKNIEVKSEVPLKIKRKLKLESEEEVSKEHSFDLGSIMEIYMYQATHAKLRQETLPILDLLKDSAKKIPKIKTNKWGRVVTDEAGSPLLDENSIRAEEVDLIDHAIKIHKGLVTNLVEGGTDTKVYTTEEKKEIDKINKLLEGELSDIDKAKLIDRKEKIGSNITGSGTIDSMLGYLRFLGLGWNITAMLPNAAAGYFANFIEASDGRLVTMKAMKKAYSIIPNSSLKLISLGKLQTETSKKISNFISKSDVLLDSTNEFQKAQINSKLTGKLDYLHPMSFNRWVEFPNQATTAISRLMSIELEEGVTVWDIFDENMDILPQFKDKYSEWEFQGEKSQNEVRKIKELIKKIHGDYSEEGRMMGKNRAIGRMAFFFKTWVARTVLNRFGAETDTTDLGVQKGRYRSLTEGSASMTGAVVGTTFMPGIGTVVGGAAGWLAGKLYGRKSEQKFIQDFMGTGVDLMKKLLRSKSKRYNDQFNEVDAANMRANMQELAFLLSMIGTYMIAKAALWDDDEPAKDQILHNIVINQINRVTMDLAFFMNPQTPGDLVDQAIPIVRVMDNGYKVMTSGLKTMYGKELKANENTFKENISKNLPVVLRSIFFQEAPIAKHEYEKEMFPNLFWKYQLYGAK